MNNGKFQTSGKITRIKSNIVPPLVYLLNQYGLVTKYGYVDPDQIGSSNDLLQRVPKLQLSIVSWKNDTFEITASSSAGQWLNWCYKR